MEYNIKKRKYLSFCISSVNSAVYLLDRTDLLVIHREALKRGSHIKQSQLPQGLRDPAQSRD